MLRKILCLILALSCISCVLGGCETVSNIAGNVLEAAGKELANQISATLEEYKVEVIEVKPLVGKLNDEGGEKQFFCAALVKTNSESSAQDCANALKKVFGEAGYAAQSQNAVENGHLVHKSIVYKHSDYSDGTYYTVYVYNGDLGKIIDLDSLKQKLATE